MVPNGLAKNRVVRYATDKKRTMTMIPKHISSFDDLVTSRAAVRDGFLGQALTKTKEATEYLDEANGFQEALKKAKAFDELLVRGHSLVIIEHNMEIIRAADHLIDLGP